jgi:hypothetical protein
MRKSIIGLATLAAAVLFGPSGAFAALPIPALPRPSQFAAKIDNPWYPLIPGTVYTYKGVKDGKAAVDVLAVTRQTTTIVGIKATVVHDKLYENGRLAERTADWYAQDRSANVWYLGERTATLDAHGKVISTEGSFKAGVKGAHAGIFVFGHPAVGQQARQEYYRGHAEDQSKVLSLSTSITTPGASSKHALLTQETTRLEPGVLDHKYYVRGIGTVLEKTVKGGDERLTLQTVRRPR